MSFFSSTKKVAAGLGIAAGLLMAGCGEDGEGTSGVGDGSDGGQLKTVTIGGKVWMAKNLNVQTDESYCYQNSKDSCAKYGRLYTWKAAKTACRMMGSGWWLPTREDWDALAQTAGGRKDEDSWPERHSWYDAGKMLKSTSGWPSGLSGYQGGTDDFGFSALPGGEKSNYDGRIDLVGYDGYWWTGDSTTCSRVGFEIQCSAYARGMGQIVYGYGADHPLHYLAEVYGNAVLSVKMVEMDTVLTSDNDKFYSAYSVRCVKN